MTLIVVREAGSRDSRRASRRIQRDGRRYVLVARLPALRCHWGNWPPGHAVSDCALAGLLDELSVLAAVEVTEAGCADVAARQHMSRCGYAMTWAETD